MMDDFRNTDKENVGEPENDSLNTEYLVSRAVGGDVQAFSELYTGYVTKIYRYVYYHVHDNTRAEDITQEVFLKAWKSIRSCKGKEKTFSSWLYRIAHNLMIDKIRKSRRQVTHETELTEDFADSSNRMEISIEQRDLLKVIDLLPPNQRQVIVLKFIEGMGNQEIADIIGKTTGAVRILQMRALAALKKRLDKE